MTAGPITIPMAASAQWVDSCSPPTRGSSRMRDKPSAHPAAQRFPDTGKSARQRISLRDCRRGEDPSRVGQQLVVGPAVYGASAFRSYYAIGGNGQGVAALDSLKGTRNSGRQAGVKLGAGGGINPQFGAPKWRVLGSRIWMDEITTNSLFRRCDRTHCPSNRGLNHEDFEVTIRICLSDNETPGSACVARTSK
jgi:hypothetical protein